MLNESQLSELCHALGWQGGTFHQALAEVRILSERNQVHSESTRIYARLATAVRAGADDATLARLLRTAVTNRGQVLEHIAALGEVQQAIRDYYAALESGKNARVARDVAFLTIEEALGMTPNHFAAPGKMVVD